MLENDLSSSQVQKGKLQKIKPQKVQISNSLRFQKTNNFTYVYVHFAFHFEAPLQQQFEEVITFYVLVILFFPFMKSLNTFIIKTFLSNHRVPLAYNANLPQDKYLLPVTMVTHGYLEGVSQFHQRVDLQKTYSQYQTGMFH